MIMNARRWFYMMLSVPIIVPLFFGLLGHLYYHIAPDPGFHYEINDGRVHVNWDSGNYSGPMGVGVSYLFHYAMLPIGKMGIIFALMATGLISGGFGYLLFLSFMYFWTRNRPISYARKILWYLPLIYIPFFFLGQLLEELWTDPTLRHMHWGLLRVIPIVLFFAYIHVAFLYLITPRKYLSSEQ